MGNTLNGMKHPKRLNVSPASRRIRLHGERAIRNGNSTEQECAIWRIVAGRGMSVFKSTCTTCVAGPFDT